MKLLSEQLTDNLIQIIISGPKAKSSDPAHTVTKIKVRPIMLKGELVFQAELFKGTQAFHENLMKDEAVEKITVWMSEDFKQLQLQSRECEASVLVSKKGKLTIKTKQIKCGKEQEPVVKDHNRKKQYLLEEGRPVPFLIDLGVQTKEGKIVHAKYDKFRQINRYLEFIRDVLPELPKDREVTILDFGCGKSYLTFAMYEYLHVICGLDIRVIGLDLKEDVIRHCSELAVKYGYEKLTFWCGDVADFDGVDKVDMVVTLHACDTATDYALHRAVVWNAKVILSVPCCQHELNKQMNNELLQPVLKYGLLKERMAALITDGLRASLLEQQGYEVQVLEFIDMEHTPKNILIRAVQKNKKPMKAAASYRRLVDELRVDPTLERLLGEEERG